MNFLFLKIIILILLFSVNGFTWDSKHIFYIDYLTAEEALDLILAEIEVKNIDHIKGSDIRIKDEWKHQQNRIKDIIAKTNYPFLFKELNTEDLKKYIDIMKTNINVIKDESIKIMLQKSLLEAKKEYYSRNNK
jgi:hypothetical protein